MCLILLDFARVNCGPINFFYVKERLEFFRKIFLFFYPCQTNNHNTNTTFKVSLLGFRRLSLEFTLLRLHTYYIMYVVAGAHLYTLNAKFCKFHYYNIYYTYDRKIIILLQRSNSQHSRRTPPPLNKCSELLNHYFPRLAMLLYNTYNTYIQKLIQRLPCRGRTRNRQSYISFNRNYTTVCFTITTATIPYFFIAVL